MPGATSKRLKDAERPVSAPALAGERATAMPAAQNTKRKT